jgi:hypothetical protein
LRHYFKTYHFAYALAVLSAICGQSETFAQSLDKETNSNIESNIGGIKTRLQQAKVDFEKIGTDLSDLDQQIKALSDDKLKLESGALVLKNGATSADFLKAEIEKLDAAESAVTAKRAEIIDELDKIYDVIAAIRTQGSSTNRQNDAPGLLKKLLVTLTAELGKPDIAEAEKKAENSKKLLTQLELFYPVLAAFNASAGGDAPGLDIVAKMGSLESALKMFSKEQLAATKGATLAATDLDAVLRSKVFEIQAKVTQANVDDIKKTATGLTSVLPKKSASDDASKQLSHGLKADLSAINGLSDLETAIQDLNLKERGLVIRILEAKFGDTYPENSYISKRWCDATMRLRVDCDRKKECDVPTDYNKSLCGYDPAPSADPRHRAVYVKYVCLQDLESNFAGIYENDSSLVHSSGRLSRPRAEYVLLREGGKILCARKN